MLDVLITRYLNGQGMINSESLVSLQRENHEFTEAEIIETVQKVLHVYFERPAHFSVMITVTPQTKPLKTVIKPATAEPDNLAADELRELMTDREMEVLQLLVKGLKANEIACNLNIDIETVRTHRQHIYNTLGIHSIERLIIESEKNNWFSSAQ